MEEESLVISRTMSGQKWYLRELTKEGAYWTIFPNRALIFKTREDAQEAFKRVYWGRIEPQKL